MPQQSATLVPSVVAKLPVQAACPGLTEGGAFCWQQHGGWPLPKVLGRSERSHMTAAYASTFTPEG